ncbi:MAG: ATP-binding protein [Pseudomonadota bacterium]
MRPDPAFFIPEFEEIRPNPTNRLTYNPVEYDTEQKIGREVTIAFSIPEPVLQSALNDEPGAILVASARRNLIARQCGQKLQGGPGDWRAERFKYYAPHLFQLSDGTCEDPRVFLDLDGWNDRAGLRAVYVGPEEAVQTSYRLRRFFAIDLAMVATGVAAIASLLALAAAALGRNRYLYLSFAIMMAAWALRNVYYVGPLSEWSTYGLGLWFFATTFALFIASAVFVNHWTIKSPFVERWLVAPLLCFLVLCLGVFAAQGFPRAAWLIPVAYGAGLASILLMFSLFVMGVYRGVGAPWFESFLFITAGSGALLDVVGSSFPFAARDLFGNEGLTIPYAPSMAILAAFAIVIFVGRQNRLIQGQLEGANARLTKTLAEREAALDTIYQERERDAREATLLRERQRIMQDIHDGFGGRLLALMLQAEDKNLDPKNLHDKLKDGMQDLRLIVDSMDTADGDLSLAFGALRGRLEPDLMAAGIELVWRIDIPETDLGLGSRETLSTYRIVQEAVANTIRHSGATQMMISIRFKAPDQLQIKLRDNGCGRDADLREEDFGQGLRNMRNRVRDLGGVIAFQNGDPGFAVEFQIPVRPLSLLDQ